MDQYLDLPIPGVSIKCPYYNNKRLSVRNGLRVLIGKGSPGEIAEEVTLCALKEKVELAMLSMDTKSQFLIDHNIGIDCSGLVYHVLDAEAKARGKGSLGSFLKFPFSRGLLARMGRFLRRRYAENTDVKTFAHEDNSHPVKWSDIRAGDILIKTYTGGGDGERNHILLVTKTDGNQVWVAQSVAKPKDGRLGHGVRDELLEERGDLMPRRLNKFG